LRRPPPSANIAPVVHDLIIVGAGPAGISTAVEAREAGIGRERILILEKGPAHSYAIRKFYPEDKRVDAVYKGIPDMHGMQQAGRLDLLMPTDIERLEEAGGRPRALYRQIPPRTYDHLVYALSGSTPAGFLQATGVELAAMRVICRDYLDCPMPAGPQPA